jgi:hypothetical protein
VGPVTDGGRGSRSVVKKHFSGISPSIYLLLLRSRSKTPLLQPLYCTRSASRTSINRTPFPIYLSPFSTISHLDWSRTNSNCDSDSVGYDNSGNRDNNDRDPVERNGLVISLRYDIDKSAGEPTDIIELVTELEVCRYGCGGAVI